MQHRIQVEFISRRKGIFRFTQGDIVQTEPFKYGFRFTNIGDNPTKKIQVSEIKWGSAGGPNIIAEVAQSYCLDVLNPRERKEIWVETTGTYAHGLHKVQLRIKSEVDEDKVQTAQKDPFSGEISDYGINVWMNFFFIYSKTESEQRSGNLIMQWFALMATIIAFANFYYFMVYQIVPAINNQKRNNQSATEDCKSNPGAAVRLTDGTDMKCSEFIKR